MDIEKLIVSLRSPSWQDLEDPDAPLLEDAAHALSTLQAENERLRDEVERQRRSADNRQHLYENAERAYMKVLAELEQAKREQSRIPEGYALVKLELLEELDNFRDLGPIDRLRELAQADLEGRCVVLPAKPDQTIYQWRKGDDCPSVSRLDGVQISGDGEITYPIWCGHLTPGDFGKTVFLTREEAALRREQDEKGGSSE